MTETSILRDSPFCKPDWRHRRVNDLIDHGVAPNRFDDAMTHRLHAHRTGAGCAGPTWPMDQAATIHDADDDRCAEIEHRLLAGQSPATVAELTGVDVSVVQAYIAIYFDVPDRLRARDWILTEVLGGPLPIRGRLTDRELLAWAAYWGGEHVLQALIDELRNPDPQAPKPNLTKMRWLNDWEQVALGTAAFAEMVEEGKRLFGDDERLPFLRDANRWTMEANGAHSPLPPTEADRRADPGSSEGRVDRGAA